MPYISQERRAYAYSNPETAGELNYAIMMWCIKRINRDKNYTTMNTVISYLRTIQIRIFSEYEEKETSMFDFGIPIENVIGNYLLTDFVRIHEVIGVLECVIQELYRRVIIPYEEEKMKEHGDLNWCSM